MSLRHLRKPRFPCPNCGKPRESNSVSGVSCRYPRHDRHSSAPADWKSPPRLFQFHLRALFIAMTIAAIFFAIFTRLGSVRFVDSLAFTGKLALVLYPIVWFFYQSISSIMLDEWMVDQRR